ncbi:MAG: PRC-barrel domain-containing protein [Clostridia bacterium]|nr:PRC-barrel domain-containing protein [Clostridia bacterium]
MELSFQTLKQKDVVSVTDGKNLGKVCDVTVSFPENNWLGITVPGCKGFKFTNKNEIFIPVNQIVKVGDDTILVKTEDKKHDCPPPPKPPCPPPKGLCPPKGKCPPKPSPYDNFPDNIPDRRDYGEYE